MSNNVDRSGTVARQTHQNHAPAPHHCPFDNQMVESMRKSMTDQLEQRRLAWEKDVLRMQEEFFKGQLGDSAALPPLTLKDAGAESSSDTTARLLQPLFNNESSDTFRLRFNVRDYNPDDINVRAEGDRLIVSAKHIEGEGQGSKVTKQFSKQVDIPSNVEAEKLISYLTSDGILTVEAPINKNIPVQSLPTCMKPLSPSLSDQLVTPESTTATLQGTPYPSIHFTDPFHDFPKPTEGSSIIAPPGNTCADVLDTEYGRMLRLDVDLGRRDYQTNEVKVKIFRNKIAVSARHEELRQGRTSKREFQREFDIPEPIEMDTLRAMLDVRTGHVFIAASLQSNSKHNMVAYLISQQQPISGKNVMVEKQY